MNEPLSWEAIPTQTKNELEMAETLPSILLVDDDELSRRLVSSLLASCGYQGVPVLKGVFTLVRICTLRSTFFIPLSIYRKLKGVLCISHLFAAFKLVQLCTSVSQLLRGGPPQVVFSTPCLCARCQVEHIRSVLY